MARWFVNKFRYFLTAIFSLFCLVSLNAQADVGVTYHGRLLMPNGQPVVGTSVRFQVQIRTPHPTSCVLFEEVHIRDLSASNGVFSITLNDGTASFTKNTGFTLARAFRNQGVMDFSGGECIGDDEYEPNPSDGRQLFVSFNDGSFSGWEPLPPQNIAFVPMAIESMTVGGHKPGNFFRVENSGNPEILTPWSIASYQKLTALVGNTTISGGIASIGGTASGFTGTLAGDVTGTQSLTKVEKIQGKDVGDTAPSDGQVLTWSTALSRWEPTTPTASTETDPNVLAFAKNTPSLDFSTPGNTLTLNTVPIPKGGTGATTRADAINNLLPPQGPHAGKILQTDGTDVSWVPTPATGITALTGDVTASGTGSVATTIANNAVNSAKILDGTIIGTDLDFSGVNGATSSFVLKDSAGKFSDFACSTPGHVPAWTVAGFVCQAPSITETDPKIGSNSLNMLSKWDGTALVASGVYENGGNVGVGTASPTSKFELVDTSSANPRGLQISQYSADTSDGLLTFNKSRSATAGGQTAVQAGDYIGGLIYRGSNGTAFQNGASIRAIAAETFTTTARGTDLAFSTVGIGGAALSERVRITNAGNVGIGTTNPGDKLHVAGKIRAQEICDESGNNCKVISGGWGSGASSLAGDVSGAFGTTTVDAIKGKTIVPGTYASGQVLKYDGTNWVNALLNIDTESTGTLSIARGGTGATIRADAINNLLPPQGPHAGKILQTDGTGVSWVPTPTTGITALTGDVTASGTGSVAAAIANNAVNSAKILDGTIIGTDMDFSGVNGATSSFVLKDSSGKFLDFACSTPGHVPAWTVAGFACQAPSITETDPKVGSNTLNVLSKWDGTALVASGVYENGGNVGVGTASPAAKFHALNASSKEVGRFTHIASDINEAVLRLQKARGTVGSEAIVQNNDSLAAIVGQGYDGSNYINAASVLAEADGTPGTNDMPGRLSFWTTPDGSNTLNERMRITNSGNVGIGTTTPQSKLDVSGTIRANEICDEAGGNCKDISSGWGAGGDIDGIVTNAGSGLSGGAASGTATLSLVTDGSTVEVNGSNQLQLKDGGITAAKIGALQVTDAKIAGMAVNKITSGAGLYLTYAPNNSPCADGAVLKKTANGWECGVDNGFTSPLTTKGDIYIRNGTVDTRLPAGADGKVLKADSGQANGLIWGDAIATDISSLTTLGIVQRNGAGSYSTVTVASPLTYTGGTLGLDATGLGDVKLGGNTVSSTMTVGTNSAHDLALETGGTTKMTILNSNGNVGIGITAPGAQLQTNTGAVGTIGQIIKWGAAGQTANLLEFQNNAGTILSRIDKDGKFIGDGSGLTGVSASPAGANTQIQFNNSGSMGASTNLVWNNTFGKLGVNNSSPSADVDVTGWIRASDRFAIYNSSGSTSNLIQSAGAASRSAMLDFVGTNAANNNVQLSVRAGGDSTGSASILTNSSHDLYFGTAGAERVRINVAGNVGIGTTTPADKLDVAGRIRATHICAPDGTNCKDLTAA